MDISLVNLKLLQSCKCSSWNITKLNLMFTL